MYESDQSDSPVLEEASPSEESFTDNVMIEKYLVKSMDFEEHLEACRGGTNSETAVDISKDQLARLELQM